jgi:enterochelin esterase-like enzyme
MESFVIDSAVYGDQREIKVYLPQEYKSHKSYPLLICHDGDDYLKFAEIKTVLDNLIQRHEVRPLVVAFTRGHDRNREYGANPRQPEFLVDEVLPAVRERYSISDDPRELGLLGASFGGVSSLYAAWMRPGVFGRLFLQSGSFVFTDVGHHGRSALWDPVVAFVNALREDPARLGKPRIYMSCGTFESLIAFNRGLVPLLRDAGLEVRFTEARDGHNWIAWRDRLRGGLTYLFPGYLWMYYD